MSLTMLVASWGLGSEGGLEFKRVLDKGGGV